MAVINHKTNTMISNIKKEDLVAFFVEARASIDVLLGMREAFDRFDDGSIDDEELYEIVSGSSIESFYMEVYRMSSCAQLPSINRYAASLRVVINEYNKKVSFFQSKFLYLEESDIATFKNLSYEILSGLLFILFYDFGISEVLESDNIDEIYDLYCKTYEIQPKDDAVDVANLVKAYKFKLDIFDEYPEYEEAFDTIIGPYRLEINEENLTIDLVVKLINGELSVSELIKMIPSSADEMLLADAVGIPLFNFKDSVDELDAFSKKE